MMDRHEDSVTGRVKSIFFQNPTNFFKILLIDITATTITWTEPDIVVTGTFGDLKKTRRTRLPGMLWTIRNMVSSFKRIITMWIGLRIKRD